MNLVKNLFGQSISPENTALEFLSEVYPMKENKEKEELVAALVGVTKNEVSFSSIHEKVLAYRGTFKESSIGYSQLNSLLLKMKNV